MKQEYNTKNMYSSGNFLTAWRGLLSYPDTSIEQQAYCSLHVYFLSSVCKKLFETEFHYKTKDILELTPTWSIVFLPDVNPTSCLVYSIHRTIARLLKDGVQCCVFAGRTGCRVGRLNRFCLIWLYISSNNT